MEKNPQKHNLKKRDPWQSWHWTGKANPSVFVAALHWGQGKRSKSCFLWSKGNFFPLGSPNCCQWESLRLLLLCAGCGEQGMGRIFLKKLSILLALLCKNGKVLPSPVPVKIPGDSTAREIPFLTRQSIQAPPLAATLTPIPSDPSSPPAHG